MNDKSITYECLVEAIIPYHFNEISNKEKAIAEIYTLRDKFIGFYKLSKFYEMMIEDSDDTEYDWDNRYEFSLSLQSLDIELGNGFLLITGGWNYSQYFYLDENGVSWLRCMFYDVLRVLGVGEAYIMDEYHGTNHIYSTGIEFGDYTMTFEDWKNEYPEPAILPISVLHSREAKNWPEIEDIYLDTYSDVKVRLKNLQQKFPTLEILTTAHITGDFILALENQLPVLVSENTGKILSFGKIDGIYNHFNSAGIEVYNGNKAAFYNYKGKKMTPYRVRNFKWRWSKRNDVFEIEVYDDKAKKVVFKLI